MCAPRTTAVPFALGGWLVALVLGQAVSGCCEPKEKPAVFELDVGVDGSCPSKSDAEGPLRKRYGSAFGSVDGEPKSHIVAASQRCCYSLSYTLDQTSASSDECLLLEADAQTPTSMPACPVGQDAVTQLTPWIEAGHTTATGTPVVADVQIQAGPDVSLSSPAAKVCEYPGTRLDSTDVCG